MAQLIWEYSLQIRGRGSGWKELLPDQFLFLSGPFRYEEVECPTGQFGDKPDRERILGEQPWGWCRSTLLPLDLKAQCGSGEQRSGTHPVAGTVVGRGCHLPQEEPAACFTQLDFQNKASQLLFFPSEVLKIGDTFSPPPRERRHSHTGAEGTQSS